MCGGGCGRAFGLASGQPPLCSVAAQKGWSCGCGRRGGHAVNLGLRGRPGHGPELEQRTKDNAKDLQRSRDNELGRRTGWFMRTRTCPTVKAILEVFLHVPPNLFVFLIAAVVMHQQYVAGTWRDT